MTREELIDMIEKETTDLNIQIEAWETLVKSLPDIYEKVVAELRNKTFNSPPPTKEGG